MTDSNASKEPAVANVASELNNLLQIISSTSGMIENVWEGSPDSEKYFAMLRASVSRAEQVTAQLVARAGGVQGKVLLHPELQKLSTRIDESYERKHRPRLLVVDDEPMALALVRNILNTGGYDPVCAQSGFEGVDLFRRDKHSFDLVLLDLTMPFMDGEEAFNRLRKIRPEIDVVLTTGFCEQERLERMMKAGLCGYLRKPFTNDELLITVNSVIERSQNSRK